MLVFDEQEVGIPIAWVISSKNKVDDIHGWLVEVYKRGKQCKEDWQANAFMTNDASAEIEEIRFDYPPIIFDISVLKLYISLFKHIILIE